MDWAWTRRTGCCIRQRITGCSGCPNKADPVRVADRYQDTMGFTVTGPNTFLGSGHPDFVADPDFPTRLGLIRSDDAGESWEIVSLGGAADFHALHSAHGLVYGWDSGTGRFMVSADDGASWDVRSTLDMFDFAVSPTDPYLLLATTTTQGIVRSIDGGRTWQPTGDTGRASSPRTSKPCQCRSYRQGVCRLPGSRVVRNTGGGYAVVAVKMQPRRRRG